MNPNVEVQLETLGKAVGPKLVEGVVELQGGTTTSYMGLYCNILMSRSVDELILSIPPLDANLNIIGLLFLCCIKSPLQVICTRIVSLHIHI